MKKFTLLSFCLVFFINIGKTQNRKIILSSDTQTSMTYHNNMPMHTSIQVYKFKLKGDAEFKDIGSYGANIAPLLENSPAAMEHFNTFKSNRQWRDGFMAIAVVGIGGLALSNLNNGTDAQGNPNSGEFNNAWLLAPAIIGFVGTLVKSIDNNINLEKAVDAYNKELEFNSYKPNKTKLDIVLGAQPTEKSFTPTIGLRLHF